MKKLIIFFMMLSAVVTGLSAQNKKIIATQIEEIRTNGKFVEHTEKGDVCVAFFEKETDGVVKKLLYYDFVDTTYKENNSPNFQRLSIAKKSNEDFGTVVVDLGRDTPYDKSFTDGGFIFLGNTGGFLKVAETKLSFGDKLQKDNMYHFKLYFKVKDENLADIKSVDSINCTIYSDVKNRKIAKEFNANKLFCEAARQFFFK